MSTRLLSRPRRPCSYQPPPPQYPPESFVTKAQELEAQGKYAQAIAAYGDAIKADPQNPALHLSLARLQIFAARYDEAISTAGNAMLLSPNNSQALVLQSWAKGMAGDFFGAEEGINTAVQTDPTNALAYAVRSIILSMRDLAGQARAETRDEAIESSRTAESMAPEMMETLWARGLILEITANYQEAQAKYQSAIQINDKIPELHVSLGRTYRALQDADKAIEEFNRANALNPSDPNPLTLIARTYANQGDFGPAIQYASDAVKNAPNDPEMYGNLGWLLYHNFQYYRFDHQPAACHPGRHESRWDRGGGDAAGLWQGCGVLLHLWARPCQIGVLQRSLTNSPGVIERCSR